MYVVLVRHGEAEPNAATPDWDLSERGVRQARVTGKRFSAIGITRVLCSPLLRAIRTAHEIAEAIDHKEVEVWPDLQEGFDSAYVGASRASLMARYPRAVLPESMPSDGWPCGGDTYETFIGRCHSVLSALNEQCGERDRVLIVSHGGFINYFLHSLLRMPDRSPVWFETAYCGLTTIRFVPSSDRREWPLYPAFDVEILGVNDSAHLSDLE